MIGKRKNKSFEYTPRYYKGDAKPFKMTHKFDEHRVTVGDNSGLKAKFVQAMADFKNNQNATANKWVLVIVLVLLIIFLFIIDFDLSIFKNH